MRKRDKPKQKSPTVLGKMFRSLQKNAKAAWSDYKNVRPLSRSACSAALVSELHASLNKLTFVLSQIAVDAEFSADGFEGVCIACSALF